MATKIFVNLPVKDLKRSVEVFTKLGYTFNPQFTDETATCMGCDHANPDEVAGNPRIATGLSH